MWMGSWSIHSLVSVFFCSALLLWDVHGLLYTADHPFFFLIFFIVAQDAIVWRHHSVFIHSLPNGHRGHWQFHVITNNAVLNKTVPIFWCTFLHLSGAGYSLRSGISRSHIFNLSKECWTIFKGGVPRGLHPRFMRAPLPHSFTHARGHFNCYIMVDQEDFLMIDEAIQFLIWILSIWISSSVKYLFKSWHGLDFSKLFPFSLL